MLPWLFYAEGEGFEPPVGCPTTVFKTAAIDHSAIPLYPRPSKRFLIVGAKVILFSESVNTSLIKNLYTSFPMCKKLFLCVPFDFAYT